MTRTTLMNDFDGNGRNERKAREANAARDRSAARDDALRAALDPGPMPAEVQERLDRTYAALGRIPQEKAPRRKPTRRVGIIAAVAAACALVSGTAFAATSLLQMGPGDADFFASDKNLPVFSSMEPGAQALSAEVGQTTTVDGMQVTLDSISCDRNVANLYLTLSREGGFDLGDLSVYEGSQEGEWARLEGLMPTLSYEISDSDGGTSSGTVSRLDAYREGADVKCLMRITPRSTMAPEAHIAIQAYEKDGLEPTTAFQVGLDMTNVPTPRELGSQDVTFETTQGPRILGIDRFTASSLATVMVARNQETSWTDDAGQEASGWPADRINPKDVKVTDDAGNVLVPVEPGDGQGVSAGDAIVIEYAGMDANAHSVTLTPILTDDAAMEQQRLERARQAARGESWNDDAVSIDVSQPGARIPLTSLGGYEITDWTVANETVTIMMRPYGWVPGVPELISDQPVTTLKESWTNPDTGESGTGEHSGIAYDKWDYATGEVAQITSYYAATEAELSALHDYRCYVYPKWYYTEDATAAKTLALTA